MNAQTQTPALDTMTTWPSMYPLNEDTILLTDSKGMLTGKSISAGAASVVNYALEMIHQSWNSETQSSCDVYAIPFNPELRQWLQVRKGQTKDLESMYGRMHLRTLLNPGDTVYVIQRHVNANNSFRVLALYVLGTRTDNGVTRPTLIDITHSAAMALGWGWNDSHGGISVGGGGMNMHFHTVYSLARAVFRGETCEGRRDDQGYWLEYESL